MSKIKNDLLKQFLNLYWLRPEVGPECTFRSISLDGLNFESPSIDISCGDGQFTFIHLGGRFDHNFDNFSGTRAKDFSHSSFVDIHDHFEESYNVKISKKSDFKIDYGTDWKQTLLDKASKLNLYKNLILHDNNKPLPFPDNHFKTIYSNAVYWVEDPTKLLLEIKRILHPQGKVILQLMTPFHLETLDKFSDFLTEEAVDILDRKRRETMPSLKPYSEWKQIVSECEFIVDEVRNVFPNKMIIDLWNIGLRPIAHLLIQMSDSLTDENRNKIKTEWVDIFYKLFKPLLDLPTTYTLETSPYLCFVLRK